MVVICIAIGLFGLTTLHSSITRPQLATSIFSLLRNDNPRQSLTFANHHRANQPKQPTTNQFKMKFSVILTLTSTAAVMALPQAQVGGSQPAQNQATQNQGSDTPAQATYSPCLLGQPLCCGMGPNGQPDLNCVAGEFCHSRSGVHANGMGA
jgi:hypothetical protein